MNRFTDERDAKEFLVGAIVQEASRRGQPLTEIERKMLYFSESGWTLPDIDAVAEAFGQQFDMKKYERNGPHLGVGVRSKVESEAWEKCRSALTAGSSRG